MPLLPPFPKTCLLSLFCLAFTTKRAEDAERKDWSSSRVPSWKTQPGFTLFRVARPRNIDGTMKWEAIFRANNQISSCAICQKQTLETARDSAAELSEWINGQSHQGSDYWCSFLTNQVKSRSNIRLISRGMQFLDDERLSSHLGKKIEIRSAA